MITYVEKGNGLHTKIKASGYTLTQLDGIWVSDNDVEVQNIIDAYSCTEIREDIITQAKEYTGEVIYSRLSVEKQLNLATRSTITSVIGMFGFGEAAYDNQLLSWKDSVLAAYNKIKTDTQTFVDSNNISALLSYNWKQEIDFVGVPG